MSPVEIVSGPCNSLRAESYRQEPAARELGDYATEYSCKWLIHNVKYREGELVAKKEKLIERLRSHPRDFTFEEAETLLGCLGYVRDNKGKTSGSRVVFFNPELGTQILLHKPHPRKELLAYQVRQLLEALEGENLI